MTDEQLIAELRAALSWELARPAQNPALQALLELKRERNPAFINPLGTQGRYAHLFDDNLPQKNL